MPGVDDSHRDVGVLGEAEDVVELLGFGDLKH